MVRHDIRHAHGTKINGVARLEVRLPVIGHHLARLGVVIARSPVKVRVFELQAEFVRCSGEHPKAFGHDFLANAVTRQHCDTKGASHERRLLFL